MSIEGLGGGAPPSEAGRGADPKKISVRKRGLAWSSRPAGFPSSGESSGHSVCPHAWTGSRGHRAHSFQDRSRAHGLIVHGTRASLAGSFSNSVPRIRGPPLSPTRTTRPELSKPL